MFYYLIVTLRTENFTTDILPAHFEYLEKLREAEILKLSGPFTDKTGGAYLVTCENAAAAEKVAALDPLISSGASAATVREWAAK